MMNPLTFYIFCILIPQSIIYILGCFYSHYRINKYCEYTLSMSILRSNSIFSDYSIHSWIGYHEFMTFVSSPRCKHHKRFKNIDLLLYPDNYHTSSWGTQYKHTMTPSERKHIFI